MPERPDIADYARAKKLVLDSGKASVSHLQRVLEVGFNQAARWMEQMEAEGVVSRPDAVGVRTVLTPAGDASPPPPPLGADMMDPF
jgi:DNA segregation ATPase FtsK/SpoIIIE-like protein